jgi:hypothetical protein
MAQQCSTVTYSEMLTNFAANASLGGPPLYEKKRNLKIKVRQADLPMIRRAGYRSHGRRYSVLDSRLKGAPEEGLPSHKLGSEDPRQLITTQDRYAVQTYL